MRLKVLKRAEAPLFYLRGLYAAPWAGAGLDLLAALAIESAPQPLLKVFFFLLIRPSSYLPLAAACLLSVAGLVQVSGIGALHERSTLFAWAYYASVTLLFAITHRWRLWTLVTLLGSFSLMVALFAALWHADLYSAPGRPGQWMGAMSATWLMLFLTARLGGRYLRAR